MTYVSQLFLTNDTGLLEILGIRDNVLYLVKGGWYLAEYFWGGILIFIILQQKRIKLLVLATIAIVFYTWQFLIAENGLNDYWGFQGIFFIPLYRGLAGLSLGAIVGMALDNNLITTYFNNHRNLFNQFASICLIVSLYCCFTAYDLDWIGIVCFLVVVTNLLIPGGISEHFNQYSYAKFVPDISLEILLLHRFTAIVTVKMLTVAGLLEYSTLKYIVYVVVTISVALLFQKFIVPTVIRTFKSLFLQLTLQVR